MDCRKDALKTYIDRNLLDNTSYKFNKPVYGEKEKIGFFETEDCFIGLSEFVEGDFKINHELGHKFVNNTIKPRTSWNDGEKIQIFGVSGLDIPYHLNDSKIIVHNKNIYNYDDFYDNRIVCCHCPSPLVLFILMLSLFKNIYLIIACVMMIKTTRQDVLKCGNLCDSCGCSNLSCINDCGLGVHCSVLYNFQQLTLKSLDKLWILLLEEMIFLTWTSMYTKFKNLKVVTIISMLFNVAISTACYEENFTMALYLPYNECDQISGVDTKMFISSIYILIIWSIFVIMMSPFLIIQMTLGLSFRNAWNSIKFLLSDEKVLAERISFKFNLNLDTSKVIAKQIFELGARAHIGVKQGVEQKVGSEINKWLRESLENNPVSTIMTLLCSGVLLLTWLIV